tara:strand:- start:9817 stop:10650 length:834 start_codon:yes stop_codon:yes gene_type:complete
MNKNLNSINLNTENSTYIIAEIGMNHGGDLKTALELIDSASKTGVDAVKFQTYITEKRARKASPIFDILKKCELDFSDFIQLKDYAESKNLDFFSTPFDEASFTHLQEIGCEIFKISSFDVVNKEFLKTISNSNKTIILSVGMSDIDEIKTAYEILNSKENNIALLHCVSSYPTDETNADLNAIQTLKTHFNCIIGQSDHTSDIYVPSLAVAAGAQIIEKHYKISESMNCIDAPVSITEQQMTQMILNIRRIEKIMGNPELKLRIAEKPTQIFRRFK